MIVINNQRELFFLARPRQSLYKHIVNMKRQLTESEKNLLQLYYNNNKGLIDLNERIFQEVLIAAHDFGKVNPFFQWRH